MRRDTAARDIGKTTVARWVSASLIGAFCVTLLAAGVVQHVAEMPSASPDLDPRSWPQPYDVFRLLASRAEISAVGSLRDALRLAPSLREITEFEDALEDASALDGAILPRAQYILSRYLGAGNEQAYLGTGGEMYYRPDVDYATGPGFLDAAHLARRAKGGPSWEDVPNADPLPAIRSLDAALRARGISLVLAPIPVRPVLQAHGLAPFARTRAVAHNPSYASFIDALAADGVRAFDATTVLAATEEPYLKADTHWTPRAVERVAGGLAAYIRDDVGLSTRAPAGYTRGREEIENVGDVAAMLKLPPGSGLIAPERVEIRPVAPSTGEAWAPDSTARVLLLGDSFTNIYSLGAMGWGEGAGLAEQLSHALQEPVDRIALNAGGAYAARQELSQQLVRGADRLADKEVVVYQFAVRELYSGDWRIYDIPTPSAVTSGPDRGPVVARARVVALSMPPQPGTVPYPDCVIAFHVSDIAAEGGEAAPDEAVVFVWGMRDNEWTPAASTAVGAQLRMRLTPWADAEAQYGSYSRRELDDEDAWLLDVYWGEILP
jgi:alginate O-acetyltransferase complex protein AlgJ